MTPIPTLDARLQAVFEYIQSGTHADIGSDHAHLPIRLVQAGRAEKCVVVELNPGPLAHAQQNVALSGLSTQIDVRQGDGFGPVQPGEVHSASLCGMGAGTMRDILTAGAALSDVLPDVLVLQPNDSAGPLRVWAQQNGFHVEAERLVAGYWTYPVLRLRRQAGPDPAYDGLPHAAALRYGPRLLRQNEALLRAQIQADLKRLQAVAVPGRPAHTEWLAAQAALEVLGDRLTQGK